MSLDNFFQNLKESKAPEETPAKRWTVKGLSDFFFSILHPKKLKSGIRIISTAEAWLQFVLRTFCLASWKKGNKAYLMLEEQH